MEGLGGAQFALPGAVERLRSQRSDQEPPLVLSAVDPAQPFGAALPWPAQAWGRSDSRRPQRVAGAYVVQIAGEPILYLERGGRALQTLVPASDSRLEPALRTLVEQVRAGRIKRIGLEKVDGEHALTSSLAGLLLALGFHEGPRRMTIGA